MIEILLATVLVLYVIGFWVCGVAFMADYTAQVDFTFWLLATVFWPVTWWYILIRVRNDNRRWRKKQRGITVTVHPMEDGTRIVEGIRWRDE